MNNDIDASVVLLQDFIDNQMVQAKLVATDITTDITRYNSYIEKGGDFSKYFVSTGFPEIDRALGGGWDRREELGTVAARPGVGKCLAKGTKVLMADGTTKNVENVVVGDVVQSYKRCNNVLALHNGISHGYKIIPNIGDSFIVSDNHILTVAVLNEYWNKEKQKVCTDGTYNIVDVSIEEYLSWSKYKKSKSRLIRPIIDYEEKQLDVPPYLFGVWLGAGNADDIVFTNTNEKGVDEFKAHAKSTNVPYLIHTTNKTTIIHIIAPMIDAFNKCDLAGAYDVFGNKHIPLVYLTGSRKQRLELLAGILDTSGSINKAKTIITITQKSKDILRQISQLCRGLGLVTGNIKSKYNKKRSRYYYTLSIKGNTEDIPFRVTNRMVANKHNYTPDYTMTAFNVEDVERVEYYGFMCDGDSRYLLWDNTLTHNTFLLCKFAEAAARQGLKVGMYSGEMSAEKVGFRFDTLSGHIPNRAITHGDLTVQASYKKHLQSLASAYPNGFYILEPTQIGHLATIADLRAFIESYKLDILFVDQHSLMEDERGAKDPVTKAANISKDLKALQVMCKIPIIAASQQNREKVEDTSGVIDVSHIAQTDRIGQDSTIVIFLEKDNDNGILKIQLPKVRDGATCTKFNYAVDFDKGIFDYQPTENNGDINSSSECNNLRNEFSTTPAYTELLGDGTEAF